jgi:protein O-mannosyl-transferase
VIGFLFVNVTRTKLAGMALAIFAATVWLYWPSTHGGFLREDDLENLIQSIRWNGLTWNAIKWAFTTTQPYWQPLARLSHVLDYQIWGKNAAGHHATSVLLHAFNAALVFGFLWTLLGAASLTIGERLIAALCVAVAFAIHPLQSESVAWMSCRTQLLCGTFGIGSVWAYTAGARRWVMWLFFAGALSCSPMAVSLPFVMLAIDYYPLRRYERFGWGRLVREKAALIALAGLVGMATMLTSRPQRGPMAPVVVISLSGRVLHMCESLTFYLVKLVWPAHLSPNYVSDLPLSRWLAFASVLTVLIITVVAVFQIRRMPTLAASWLSYMVLVLPISGLIPFERQLVALRYAYMAMLPVLLFAGAAGIWMWRRSATGARGALVGLLACELCVFAAGTRRLIPDWYSSETMWRATSVALPDSEEANRELTAELLGQGKDNEALEYAQRGVKIAPQACDAHVMLGLVLSQLGRVADAIEQDTQAVQINPYSAKANQVFGLALAQAGKPEEAMARYEQALQIEPNYIEARCNLGVALLQVGRVTEAVEQFERALRISATYADAHYNLGVALAQTGKIKEAIEEYEQALRMGPENAGAHNGLGSALLRTGNVQEAVMHYEEALRINPGFAEAHYNLGIALAQTGRVPEAMGHWEQVLRLKPDHVEAHYNLGCALERQGHEPEAIEQFKQALKLRPDYAPAKDALTRLQAHK